MVSFVPPIIIDQQQPPARVASCQLIVRPKAIPVEDQPFGANDIGDPKRFLNVIGLTRAVRCRLEAMQFAPLTQETGDERFWELRGGKGDFASRVLPGLCERQAAHHMPRADD